MFFLSFFQFLVSLTAFGADLSEGARTPLLALDKFDAAPFLAQQKKIEAFLTAYSEPLGFRLVITNRWESGAYNANVEWKQASKEWTMEIHGGLARHPESNPDTYLETLCHEAGHLVGGYPFSGDFTANEGQADYFAASVCLPRLWEKEKKENALALKRSAKNERAHCAQKFSDKNELGLCVRILRAKKQGNRIMLLEKKFNPADQDLKPGFKALERLDIHPIAACRIETTKRAALCRSSYPEREIPSLQFAANAIAAKSVQDQFFCESEEITRRPDCWYQPPLRTEFSPALEGTALSPNGYMNGFLAQDFTGGVFFVTLTYGVDEGSGDNVRVVTRSGGSVEIPLEEDAEFGDRIRLRSKLSLAEVRALGIEPFTLASARAGEKVEILSFQNKGSFACQVAGEGKLNQDCQASRMSQSDLGAPLLRTGTRKVVGIFSRGGREGEVSAFTGVSALLD